MIFNSSIIKRTGNADLELNNGTSYLAGHFQLPNSCSPNIYNIKVLSTGEDYLPKMGVLGSHDASKVQVMDFSLRVFLIPFNVATIWITVTTKQDNSTYGTLEFNNLVGLKYMVSISAVSTGYAVLAAVSTRLRLLVTKPWLFFVTDQIMAYLMLTSVAAQGEFLDLAFNGAQAVTWSEACASYGKVCSRVMVALALHVLALCCFLLLAVISAYRVFKRFEPPSDLPDKEPQPL